MMLEALGIVFGGVARLGQHFMDLKDKQAERDHEFRMVDQTLRIQEQQKSIRSMEIDGERDKGEMDALIASINSQESSAKVAGGWVAGLSASVRPITTYWLVVLYSFVKFAIISLAISNQVPFVQAVASAYTEFDGALLGSVMGFWFADRSLRRKF